MLTKATGSVEDTIDPMVKLYPQLKLYLKMYIRALPIIRIKIPTPVVAKKKICRNLLLKMKKLELKALSKIIGGKNTNWKI